jgi:hypothetical protein
MNPINCPRYERCSAAICPLWKSVLIQKMVKGERVCGILLEYSKIPSRSFLEGLYGPELMKVMSEATEQIKAHGGYLLRSALKRAAVTGTRLSLQGCNTKA